MLRQVLRRSTRHEPRLAELPRHQVVRARRPDTDGEVESLLDQIDDPIRKGDIETYLRVTLEKLSDGRRDMAHAEIHRRREANRAPRHDGGAGGLLLRLGQI